MNKKKKIYTVHLNDGKMGLEYGTKENIILLHGTYNIQSIEVSTKEDIEWIRGMGGHIPPQVKQKEQHGTKKV